MKNNNNNNKNELSHSIISSYLDSKGNELKEGDVFEYTSKKWKSKERIVRRGNNLGVIVSGRDVSDIFVPLEKYIKRHYMVKLF